MSKRGYSHVQALLPEIQAMVEAGKNQSEIAEHFGFTSKMAVKVLLNRKRRKAECINRVRLITFEEANLLIDEYIYFYNHEHNQLKTKLTPLEQRCQFLLDPLFSYSGALFYAPA